MVYPPDHLSDLLGMIAAVLEVLPNPVFQDNCFAHIDDFILGIPHDIDARLRREFFQFFFYIKHTAVPFFIAFVFHNSNKPNKVGRKR
jgi:hypothetical protein